MRDERDGHMLIETNAGTFGAGEACRAVGTGDPAFATYWIFMRPDGSRRIVGCDPRRAPGRARVFCPEAKRVEGER